MTIRSLLLAAATAFLPAVAGAQVGYLPRNSPYRDLEHRQEFTFFGGQYQARKDPARVAPQSGPMVGMHYEFRMTGPAYFTVTTAMVKSERRVIDPNQLLATRFLGTKSVNMLLTDIGFALNLTGYKSWHGLVPSLGGGIGLGAGFDKPDTGFYKFGYPFLLTLRPAIKFAPRGHWQGRIEAAQLPVPDPLSRHVLHEVDRGPDGAGSDRRAQRVDPQRGFDGGADLQLRALNVARAYLTRRVTFAAAHRYRRPEWDDARNEATFGPCARPNYHGHSYTCDVTVAGTIDPLTGFVVDLGVLDGVLAREVRDRYDHRNLNLDIAEFADGARIPSGENLAVLIFDQVQAALGDAAQVVAVEVAEDATLRATYRGEEQDGGRGTGDGS